MGKRLNRAVLGLAKARSRKYFDIREHAEGELPLEGILFSNHESLIDPPLIATALHDILRNQGRHFLESEKIPHYLAKKELQETLLKPIYDSLELIYVNRNGSSKEEFDRYVAETNRLVEHNYIGFFYPGTRSDALRKEEFEEDKKRAESGIFAILNRCEDLQGKTYPIIPISVSVDAEDTEERKKSKTKDFARILGYATGLRSPSKEKPKAIIAFGEPVYESFPLSRKRRHEVSEYLIETVHALRQKYD